MINLELEQLVLGEIAACSCIDPGETRQAVQAAGLVPAAFTTEVSREIFGLMTEAMAQGQAAGALQLEHQLKARNISATWLAARQAQAHGSMVMVKRPIEDLLDLMRRRDLRAVAQELLERAGDFTESPEATLHFLSKRMGGLVAGSGRRLRRLSEKMPIVSDELAAVGTGRTRVLKTGIELWDKNVGGLWPTLTVIGGHPSRGKSGLALSMIKHLAMQGHRPGIFTLEDTAEWMIYRLLGDFSRVSSFFMRTRPMNEKQQEAVGAAWAEVERIAAGIVFDERSRPTPLEVLAGAREMILNEGVSAVFIDHAGELNYEAKRGGERFDLDVAEGLMDLRALAKDHNTPVVLLSHLTRGKKPPHSMEDFANAAAVERCARVAAIVWSNDGAPLEPFVSIVKNTFGKRDFDLKFRLDPASALVDEPTGETPTSNQETLFS